MSKPHPDTVRLNFLIKTEASVDVNPRGSWVVITDGNTSIESTLRRAIDKAMKDAEGK